MHSTRTVENFQNSQNLRKIRFFGIIYIESEGKLTKTIIYGGIQMEKFEFREEDVAVVHTVGNLRELNTCGLLVSPTGSVR